MHHGELIGIHAVGAPQDKIAAAARQILAVRALQAVGERNVLVRHDQPPRGRLCHRGALCVRELPARSGIYRLSVGGVRRACGVELRARAVARIHQPPHPQGFKRGGIVRASPTLRRLLLVPVQPKPQKVFAELRGVFWAAAVGVKILDAQHHFPARRAHRQPRQQRGKYVSQMHPPARARRKAPHDLHSSHLFTVLQYCNIPYNMIQCKK